MKISYSSYRLLTGILFWLIFPFILFFKKIRGKTKYLFTQRFGFYDFPSPSKKTARIWVHAASVGETGAACSIIDEIKKIKPDVSIILSTVTTTGLEAANRLTSKDTIKILAPLDFERVTEASIEFFKPDIIVLTETELWPNLIKTAAKKDIRVITANGRISDSSIKTYKKIQPLVSEVLSSISCFSMISENDLEKIIEIGADKSKIKVSGNSKYDQALKLRSSANEIKKSIILRQLFNITETPVIVAGSTRPGEEEIILSAFTRIKETTESKPILIIAPRHLERCDEIQDLLNDKNICHEKKTSIQGSRTPDCRIIILDTMGELAAAYRIADLVICGGSLMPFGGQNPLEAAAMEKPIIFGPHTDDFACESAMLKECGAAKEVRDSDELLYAIEDFLGSKDIRETMGKNAYSAISENSGAARKNAEIIIKHL